MGSAYKRSGLFSARAAGLYSHLVVEVLVAVGGGGGHGGPGLDGAPEVGLCRLRLAVVHALDVLARVDQVAKLALEVESALAVAQIQPMSSESHKEMRGDMGRYKDI